MNTSKSLQNYFTNADSEKLGMTDKPKPFKQVNIARDRWEEYNQAAITLSAERGERVSIPALLHEAYTKYISSI